MPPSSSPPAPGRPPSWADDERAVNAESGARTIVLEEGALLAGKYKLARPAGFGGMAQLWVATNQATGAEVCIKILVPTQSDNDSVERFRREAYAAARLSHRAIVRIFDLVELSSNGEVASNGKPEALAIVMELLHGETLGDYLMKKGKLPLDEAIDLTLPFLSALAHAHRAGVVHRDLKPDNIFLSSDPDGHVIPKVLDFGVSKMSAPLQGDGRSADSSAKSLTVDGVMLGTPSFMSPEQARGARNVDARSDVFTAGIVFYMMLAGGNPFECEGFHSVISAIMHREVPRLAGVPDAIWAVIEKALEKDPGDRYADATELGIALRRASGRTSTTDSGPQSLPTGARAVVPPLGGDSIVTVPPVGNAELGDARAPSELEMPTDVGRAEASRRRALRIVAAVVGVSLVIMVAALLRSPEGSSGKTSGTPTTAPAAPSVTPIPTVTATATVPATATATAADQAVTDKAAGVDAGVAKVGPRIHPPSLLPPPKKKVDPAPGGPHKEPSIVRDPGF